MYVKIEVTKHNNGLKIKLFKTENMYKIFFINDKGMYVFLNENVFNDCLNGKKSYLISSLIFNGYEAVKEIKYFIKQNIFEKQEHLDLIKEYMNKIKI